MNIDQAVAEFNLRQKKFLKQVEKGIRSLVKNTSKTECLSVIATSSSRKQTRYQPWGSAWRKRFRAVRKHKSHDPEVPTFPEYDGETLDSPLSKPIQNKVQELYRQFYQQNSDIVNGLIADRLRHRPDVQQAIQLQIIAAIRSSVAPVSTEIYEHIAHHIVQVLTGEVPAQVASIAGDAAVNMTTDIALSAIAGAMVHSLNSALCMFVLKTVGSATVQGAMSGTAALIGKAVMAGVITTASTQAAVHGSAATFTLGAYFILLPIVVGIVTYQVYRFPSKLGKRIAKQVCNKLKGKYESTNRGMLTTVLDEVFKDGRRDIWEGVLSDGFVKRELEKLKEGLMSEKGM